ncbi:MAG: hypothetical protein HKN33_16560, partial [Pyrinomonadaceae bacterium]|nr:hypothetical protein [Pyrinomonadaceae bacterium]
EGLPDELKDLGGWVVAKPSTDLAESPFVVVVLRPAGDESFEPTMIWLEERVFSADQKKYTSKVFDVMNLPKVKKNQRLVLGGQCHLDGKPDSRFFAVAVYEDKEYFTNLLKAWKVNVEAKKFESAKIDRIKCENLEYGL